MTWTYPGYGKEGPDHLLPLANPLAGQAAGGDGEEGRLALRRDALADQGLAGAGRAEQEEAFGRRPVIDPIDWLIHFLMFEKKHSLIRYFPFLSVCETLIISLFSFISFFKPKLAEFLKFNNFFEDL